MKKRKNSITYNLRDRSDSGKDQKTIKFEKNNEYNRYKTTDFEWKNAGFDSKSTIAVTAMTKRFENEKKKKKK